MKAADRSSQQFDREWVHYQNEWELLMKLSVKNKNLELAKKLTRERNDSLAKRKDKRTGDLHEKYQAEMKAAREQLTSRSVKSFAAAKAVSVASSVDLYEPNDDVSQASPVSAGNSIESYLSYSGDQDFYSFEAKKNAPITVSLQGPSAMDYDVYVLDELGEVVASSANGTGEEEMASFQATAGSKYYPVVHGFGFSTDEPYQLRLAEDQLEVTPFLVGGQPYYVKLSALGGNLHTRIRAELDPQSYPELKTNNSLDVTLEGVSRNVYKFTPDVSGNVKFFTSPFGEGDMVVDTVLELYSDEKLTSQIATNDDNGESLFSEIQMYGKAGDPVYVVLWAYSEDFSFVRLNASADSSGSPTIAVGSPVIQENSINDGTISATQVITLANGAFVQDMSSGVTVNNLPPGLGVQVTRMSDTQLSIAFTGKALNHANVNDVSNATVSIAPAKVVGASTSLTSNPFRFDFIDTASGGSFQYVYNNRNQLMQIYENGTLIIEITYDENGNVLTKTRVN
ncbi:putative pre-peptidase [Brevibacillus sp. BC25]|nr:putative pre-peptidase [Brevibacillus sp. BC25]